MMGDETQMGAGKKKKKKKKKANVKVEGEEDEALDTVPNAQTSLPPATAKMAVVDNEAILRAREEEEEIKR